MKNIFPIILMIFFFPHHDGLAEQFQLFYVEVKLIYFLRGGGAKISSSLFESMTSTRSSLGDVFIYPPLFKISCEKFLVSRICFLVILSQIGVQEF